MRQRFSFFRHFDVLFLLVLGLTGIAGGQTALEPGRAVERDLAEDETHSYRLTIKKGEYVRIVVRQKNRDVRLFGYLPDGRQFVAVDNSNTVGESEILSFIAEDDGTFRFDVNFVGLLPTIDGRAYEIRLEIQQPAREPDKSRTLAESLYREANQLRFKKERESKERSVRVFREAVPLFAAAGDKTGEALAIYAVGQVLGQLGDYAGAQAHYEQAAGLFSDAGDLLQFATVLENSAPVYFRRFNIAKTTEVLTRAQRIYEQINYRRGVVSVASKFGLVYQTLGDSERAIKAYSESLPLLEHLGDLPQKATTLSNLATLHEELGNLADALENHTRALEMRRQFNDGYAVGNTLINLASVYRRMGETEKFLAAINEALAIFRERGERAGESTALNNLAAFYFAIGQLAKAAETHAQALTIWRRLNFPQREAQNLINLADVQFAQKNTAGALENYDKALTLARQISDRRTEGIALMRLGAVSLEGNNSKAAAEFLREALSISKETGDIENEADTRILSSRILQAAGENEQALENLRRALTIMENVRDTAAESTVLVQMSRLMLAKGDLPSAQALAERAVDHIETGRRSLNRTDFRAGFVAGRQKTYENLIDVLIRRHRMEPDKGFAALALRTSEMARARNLLDSIGSLDLRTQDADEGDLIAKEKVLLRTINEKEFRRTRFLLDGEGAPNVAAIDDDLRRLIDELRQVQSEIRGRNPRLSDLKEPRIASVARIQNEILSPQTVLLEYFIGEDRSWLFFVSDKDLEVFELPSENDLNQVAKPMIAALRNVPRRKQNETDTDFSRRSVRAENDLSAGTETLSKILLGPVAARIAGKRILVVGSGILQYLPFGALQNTIAKSYLIETNEVVYLPSVSVLARLRESGKRVPTSDLAIFADPVFDQNDTRVKAKIAQRSDPAQNVPAGLRAGLKRLEFSRYEAEAIAKLFPANQRTIALDFDANLRMARRESLRSARFIHFASHGWVNSAQPELSGIVLSLVDETGAIQDGFLRLSDIYNLSLSADLVVLSACETGLGEEIRGEGIIGLTRGFMHAGAPRVISSLWSVDDRATYQLMRRFYENMLTGKLSAAAALRKAQISMIQERSFAKPFFWAAFTIHGEFE